MKEPFKIRGPNVFPLKKWLKSPTHRVIYLKETRVRTAHAARKMLLCRLEAAKRHLNPGKILAYVCFRLGLGWLLLTIACVCVLALASVGYY